MPPKTSTARLIWPILLATLGGVIFAWDPNLDPWDHSLPALVIGNFRNGAGAVSLLALAWFGKRLFDLVMLRAIGGDSARVPRLLNDLVGFVLFVLATVASFAWIFHLPVAGLVTASSVVVAVTGFALRDIIGDIFSGIALNIERPYGLGDWLELEGGSPVGRVIEINWRATRMITQDGILVVVPNGRIAKSRFQNYNQLHTSFRATLPVMVDYDVPVERALRVLHAAVKGAPDILAAPAPDVLAEAYTERGIRYAVRFWVPDWERMTLCRSQVAASVHRHLRLAGIALPHARQDITFSRAREVTDDRQRRVALLGQVAMFEALPGDVLGRLAEDMLVRCATAGDDVVIAGEDGRSLFVLVEGLLEVRDGAGGALARLGPGDVFGEMSLLTGAPRSATVAAVTEATLFEITDDQLRPILQARPELAASLGAIVAERQQANYAQTLVMAAGEAEHDAAKSSLLARIRDFFGLVR